MVRIVAIGSVTYENRKRRYEMILTDEQVDQLKEASKPLVKFLNENCNPHAQVVVDITGVELLQSSVTVKIEEYLND